MNTRFLLVCLLLCSITALHAQLMGKVVDENNNPLAHCTIFVPSTGQGTVTNQDGYYSFEVDQGRRIVVFQFLGYKTVEKTLNIGASQELNVQLGNEALELQVVEIYEGRENPAYTIMRKAIAKASWHRQQIDAYTATTYIKGSGRLKKSPFLLRGAMKKEGIDSTFAFTSESVSEIEYRRPNYFKEKVISYYQQGDNQGIDANQYVNQTFYQEDIMDIVSPLSPKAFGYYKFEMEGFFMDRGYGVNKIRVIPRSKGEGVFEGTIYILEDLWAIHSANLDTYIQGVKANIQQNYAPIQESAWMPINVKMGIDGAVLGFAFEYNYLATLNNYNITLNPDLSEDDFAVIDEKINKELAQQLEDNNKNSVDSRIANGGELTRKELRKLMKEYEKEERNKQEEPEVISNHFYEVDSLAANRDTAYWENLRPVPLTRHELKGYQRADSLAIVAKQEAEQKETGNTSLNKKKKGGGFALEDIPLGGTYKVGSKNTLSFSPLLLGTNFNPVEGFNLRSRLTYKIKGKNNFYIDATPRYAFSRKTLTGKGGIRYIYGDSQQRNKLQVEGGRYLYQYNDQSSLHEILNTYLNLIEHKNYIRLYEKDFVQAKHEWKIKENWILKTGLQWANYYTLDNTTSQTWFPRSERYYAANRPVNAEIGNNFAAQQKSSEISLELTTRPWQKYRRYNGKKQTIDNTSPTIHIGVHGAVKGILGSQTQFLRTEVGARHRFTPRAGSTLKANIRAGLFLNNDELNFANYKHFQGNQITIATIDPNQSYRLLPYYEASTRDQYINIQLQYQFRKLLFTQIPEVWLLGIKEEFFTNYLHTPQAGHYQEVGYALDNIFRLFRVEGVVSFQDGQYRDWGIFVGVTSNIVFSAE